MFAARCPRRGQRSLVGPDEIVRLRNGPEGISIDWSCTCGETHVWRALRSWQV